MLAERGFKDVYNMKGGIKAWEGPVADGPVEMNLHMVRGDESPEEIIKLAFGMENGLGRFYRAMSDRIDEESVKNLLLQLASIEDRHKDYLSQLYQSVTGSRFDPESADAHESAIIEGGFDMDEFMETNERFMQTATGLIDISMMLEAQALDLYLRFAGKVESDEARSIVFKIADEEKTHLNQLGRLREDLT